MGFAAVGHPLSMVPQIFVTKKCRIFEQGPEMDILGVSIRALFRAISAQAILAQAILIDGLSQFLWLCD